VREQPVSAKGAAILPVQVKVQKKPPEFLLSCSSPLSHTQVGWGFQRRTAHAADHRRAVTAGQGIGDLAPASGAVQHNRFRGL